MKAAEWNGRLPGGLLLLDPEDPTFGGGQAKLLTRLSRVGIEQFIVPDRIIESAIALLAEEAELGLVLSAEAMTSQTAIAGLPTAFLLPDDKGLARFLVAHLRSISVAWPNLPMIVIAEPDRLLVGRRIDQTVSTSAPIRENALDSLK